MKPPPRERLVGYAPYELVLHLLKITITTDFIKQATPVRNSRLELKKKII